VVGFGSELPDQRTGLEGHNSVFKDGLRQAGFDESEHPGFRYGNCDAPVPVLEKAFFCIAPGKEAAALLPRVDPLVNRRG